MIDTVHARAPYPTPADREVTPVAAAADVPGVGLARPLALLVTPGRAREQVIRARLERAGLLVIAMRDPARGAREAAVRRPAVIVLDGTAFEQEGLGALAHFRRVVQHSPLLLLTSATRESLTVAAIRGGADDVAPATATWPELAARTLALARRAAWQRGNAPTLLRFGDIEIDPAARVVRRAGQWIDLAPKELALLVALARRSPGIATRRELLEEVWGYSGDVVTRTVDTHVRLLRKKLEPDPSRPRHIRTAQRTGYRLAP